MSGVAAINTDDFDTVIRQSNKPVLVDFWAEWCAPCKIISPIIEELAEEYEDEVKVVKISLDDNPDFITRYNIRSIPTLSVFNNGEVVSTRSGVLSVRELRKFVNNAAAL